MDYDQRPRDAGLEMAPVLCRTDWADVEKRLGVFSGRALEEVIEVRMTPDSGSSAESLKSTIGRELVFLSSHTLHHLATVVLIARAVSAEMGDEISLAFSTEAHRRSLKTET